jgi:glycosyltransferase involved in cell wall biosynthesis
MRVAVLVSNDLTYDQRVSKICDSLQHKNWEVRLVGVLKSGSTSLQRNYSTQRLNVFFTKGPLFYFMLNVRMFFYLLLHKTEIIWANDLDVLWPAVLMKKLRGTKVIYDSHEYFTESEGLTGRERIKAIWTRIEERCIPHVDLFITVNESIVSIYRKKYNREVLIQRNMPILVEDESEREALFEVKTVVLQGAYIDPDRGGMELVEAFQFLEGIQLLIVGAGRDLENIKRRIIELHLEEKVKVLPRMSYLELKKLTQRVHLGVSLDKPLHLNYTLSLPNKLFDYIHAGVPVLVSNLVEPARIVNEYLVGEVIEEVTPKVIAEGIQKVLNSASYEAYRAATKKAKSALHWQADFDKIDFSKFS